MKNTTALCPRCGRRCTASGSLTVAGQTVPLSTYQCDECVVTADFCGEAVEMALTFAVGADGVAFDPAGKPGAPTPWFIGPQTT